MEELCACLERQLDFRREAAANRRLRRAMACERGVVVPGLVEELCSQSTLTMELIAGTPDPGCLPAEQARTAVRAAVRSVYRMIFVEGFVHCDLHHGNLRFLPDGRVALLEFGFMAELEDSGRLAFAKFFYAMAINDGPLCALLTVEFRVADFVGRLFDLQRRHGIRATSEFATIILSLLVLEGIVNEVHPDLDFQSEAQPYIFRASIRRAAPARSAARPRLV